MPGRVRAHGREAGGSGKPHGRAPAPCPCRLAQCGGRRLRAGPLLSLFSADSAGERWWGRSACSASSRLAPDLALVPVPARGHQDPLRRQRPPVSVRSGATSRVLPRARAPASERKQPQQRIRRDERRAAARPLAVKRGRGGAAAGP